MAACTQAFVGLVNEGESACLMNLALTLECFLFVAVCFCGTLRRQ